MVLDGTAPGHADIQHLVALVDHVEAGLVWDEGPVGRSEGGRIR
jgi:hypothetical protein